MSADSSLNPPLQQTASEDSPRDLPPQQMTYEDAIVADEDPDDEALGLEDGASSSASIISSVLQYRHENGRRYHGYKDGSYIVPNDDIENERLDVQHHMFRIMFDGDLFLAPADPAKIERVLDAGTGTGIWAIDIADELPHAQVIGVDLSPTQPDFVPTNLQFYVDDVEDEWTYSYKFDLVLARMFTASISDWPKFFNQSFKHMSPGGYIEVSDITFPLECTDGTLSTDSALYRWGTLCSEAAEKLGRPLDAGTHYAKRLEEAGFTNIVERKFKWPQNNWPKDPRHKEMGLWTYETVGRNVYGLSVALFTRVLGWKVEDFEVFLIEVRKEMKDRKIHAYFPIYVVYAQKPEDA